MEQPASLGGSSYLRTNRNFDLHRIGLPKRTAPESPQFPKNLPVSWWDFCVLFTGHSNSGKVKLLFCREDDSSFYAYHSDTAVPQDSFRPVIQTCPTNIVPGSTIQISGLQFNGLSQAVAYGDDSQTATNYPLVRIVNKQSGHVRYCRTFNHTTVDGSGNVIPSMGVATGAAVITTNVVIPDDIEFGDSSVFVVANGIPSQPFDAAIWPILV